MPYCVDSNGRPTTTSLLYYEYTQPDKLCESHSPPRNGTGP